MHSRESVDSPLSLSVDLCDTLSSMGRSSVPNRNQMVSMLWFHLVAHSFGPSRVLGQAKQKVKKVKIVLGR